MEDREDLLRGSGGATHGFRLPINSVGVKPKEQEEEEEKQTASADDDAAGSQQSIKNGQPAHSFLSSDKTAENEDRFLHQNTSVFSSHSTWNSDQPCIVTRIAMNTNMNITRVLFCGSQFPAFHAFAKEYLQKYPFIQVDMVPAADVPKVIENYHLCVPKNLRLDSNVISRAKQMKLILQYGVGLEGVDIDAATNCGIKVARIPSDGTGNAASCAEMAIYLMLGLLRKQNEMQIAVKQEQLGEPVGETLLGKTVYIMGFGNIGIHLAKRLRPFGVKIIVTKRSWASHNEVSSQSNALPVENGIIDDLVDEKGSHEDRYKFASKADIVVCCLLLNKETVGVVNRSFISSMKKGSLVVNIARGGHLDYEAVRHYLECGHLGGLGIDVAWTEPFNPDDPILKFNNVIITPHVAGVTELPCRYMAKVVSDVALQLHAGTPLTGIEIVN